MTNVQLHNVHCRSLIASSAILGRGFLYVKYYVNVFFPRLFFYELLEIYLRGYMSRYPNLSAHLRMKRQDSLMSDLPITPNLKSFQGLLVMPCLCQKVLEAGFDLCSFPGQRIHVGDHSFDVEITNGGVESSVIRLWTISCIRTRVHEPRCSSYLDLRRMLPQSFAQPDNWRENACSEAEASLHDFTVRFNQRGDFFCQLENHGELSNDVVEAPRTSGYLVRVEHLCIQEETFTVVWYFHREKTSSFHKALARNLPQDGGNSRFDTSLNLFEWSFGERELPDPRWRGLKVNRSHNQSRGTQVDSRRADKESYRRVSYMI